MPHKRTLFKAILLTIWTVVVIPTALSAQAPSLPQLSEKALVSVVTCSAAPNYEESFGHSALRIQDAALGIDVVFNFGSYTEGQSFLAYKLLQGTMVSYLDGEPFKAFVNRYKSNGRGINEYYLRITKEQKQALWEELNRILIGGDRFYKFNFIDNNCCTQLRDLLFEQCQWDKTRYETPDPGQKYRDISLSAPLRNSWLYLLFNTVLGPQTDKSMSPYQAGFTPNGLIRLLKEVRPNDEPVLMLSRKICSPTVFEQMPDTSITRGCCSLLLLIACVLAYRKLKKGKRYLWFDRALLFFSGLFGCLLASLVLTSEVTLTSSNYNLLWALPTNLLLLFVLTGNPAPAWRKAGIVLTCLSLLAFPVVAAVGGQTIPVEIYLISGTLLVSLLSALLSRPMPVRTPKRS